MVEQKKSTFRMVPRNLWRWARKSKIRGNNLLVLLALETGPWGEGEYTGLYRLGLFDLADYTGLTQTEVSRAVDALERAGIIVFDRDRQVVFVHGMLARQCPNFSSSDNTLLGIVNHVERMPEGSPAVDAFIKAQEKYPELFELLEGYLQGDYEGDPEETRDLRLETRDLETRDTKTVIAEKSPALTPPLKPSSSTSTSKGNGTSKAKASCKGNDNGKAPRSIVSVPKARAILDTLPLDERLVLAELLAKVREYDMEPEDAFEQAITVYRIPVPVETLDQLLPLEATQ